MLVLGKMLHRNCALAVHTHTHTLLQCPSHALCVRCCFLAQLPNTTTSQADPKLRASLPPCLHSVSEPKAPPPSRHFLEEPWDRCQHSHETRSKHFLSSTFSFTWQVSRFNLAGGRLGYEWNKEDSGLVASNGGGPAVAIATWLQSRGLALPPALHP